MSQYATKHAMPCSRTVVQGRGAHVQLTKTEDGGCSFHADILIGGANVGHVYGEGLKVFYSDVDLRWRLGRTLMPGANGDEAIRLAPYFDALATAKVFTDVAVSLLATQLCRLATTNLIAALPGDQLVLIPTQVRSTATVPIPELALWEATHDGGVVVNNMEPVGMAATLVALSSFKSTFMDALRTHENGAALTGWYKRAALAYSDAKNLDLVLGQKFQNFGQALGMASA